MRKKHKVIVGSVGTMGERLNTWRKKQHLTLIELGKNIGVSQGSLSELENDKSMPSAGTLRSLCLNTEINIYWLLTGEGGMRRDKSGASEQPGLSSKYMIDERDHKLKDLINCLIRIYKKGDVEKNAHLYGYLHGADSSS